MQEREPPLIARVLCAALFIAGLLQPSPAHSQLNPAAGAQRVIEGPLHSARNLRAFKVFGVHLGMSAPEAVEALTAAGLVAQGPPEPEITESPYESLGSFNVPQAGGWVQLHYSKPPGREAVISGINYWRKLSGQGSGAVEQLRAELIATYGEPTVWTQQVDERGALRDSAVYVPARRFVESSERKMLHACSVNWVCAELREKVDCRDMLKRSGAPLVEIRFSPEAIIYQIFDSGPVYGALSRDARFRGEEPAEAACPATSAE